MQPELVEIAKRRPAQINDVVCMSPPTETLARQSSHSMFVRPRTETEDAAEVPNCWYIREFWGQSEGTTLWMQLGSCRIWFPNFPTIFRRSRAHCSSISRSVSRCNKGERFASAFRRRRTKDAKLCEE